MIASILSPQTFAPDALHFPTLLLPLPYLYVEFMFRVCLYSDRVTHSHQSSLGLAFHLYSSYIRAPQQQLGQCRCTQIYAVVNRWPRLTGHMLMLLHASCISGTEDHVTPSGSSTATHPLDPCTSQGKQELRNHPWGWMENGSQSIGEKE